MKAKTVRVLTILTALFSLGAAIYAAQVFAENALSELYQKNTFLLWNDTALSGGKPVCAAFYWKVRAKNSRGEISRSFYLSTGHVKTGRLVRDPNDDFTYRKTTVLFQINKSDFAPDFLVGTMSDERINPTYFKELTGNLKDSEPVFMAKIMPERGKTIELQRLQMIEDRGDYLSFRSEYAAQEGMSGLPVVTGDGKLVGIFIGFLEDDPFIVYVMPMREVIKVYTFVSGDMKELGSKKPNAHGGH